MPRAAAFQLLFIAVLVATGCASGAPNSSAPQENVAPRAEARTMIAIVKREPTSLSIKMKQESSLTATKRLFNAGLSLIGEDAIAYPYLAEKLPELHTDSWRVFPDGRMETTYALRPGLQWQDGTPLSAEDFAFALRVYTTRGVDVTLQTPQDRFAELLAPDERTVVIRWARLFPDAGRLTAYDFPPLPRHLLEQSFREEPLEAFLADPYWTRDYIGVGPYKVDRWEPGTFLEASAFRQHALGAPKIDRIQVRFVPDENTSLAAFLAGTAHVAFASGLELEQSLVLRREWTAGQGTIKVRTGEGVYWQLQFRPEMVNPKALLDVRVRKALAHSIDRHAFVDMQYGLALPADTLISREDPAYPDVDRAIVKYPYDLRQTEALLREAGFTKGSDGSYNGPDGRLSVEVKWNSTSANNLEGPLLAEGWRRAGIEATETVFPESRLPDGEFRANFASMQWGGAGNIMRLVSSTIPSAQNRWVGTNRGAWSNAAYDRLFDAFNTTLDRDEQTQELVAMMKLASEELPVLTTFHAAGAGTVRVAALAGVRDGPTQSHDATWNVHEWHWQ